MNVKLTDAEVDKGAALFLAEVIRQIDLQIDDINMKIKKGADRLPEDKKKELLAAANKLAVLKGIAVTQMKTLAPVVSDPEAAKQILGAIALGDVVKALVNRATALGMPQPYSNDLNEAAFRLAKAMEALMTATQLAEKQGATGEVDLTTPVQQLINDLARVRTNIEDPRAVIEAVKAAAADQNDIITATSTIAKNAEALGDSNTKAPRSAPLCCAALSPSPLGAPHARRRRTHREHQEPHGGHARLRQGAQRPRARRGRDCRCRYVSCPCAGLRRSHSIQAISRSRQWCSSAMRARKARSTTSATLRRSARAPPSARAMLSRVLGRVGVADQALVDLLRGAQRHWRRGGAAGAEEGRGDDG